MAYVAADVDRHGVETDFIDHEDRLEIVKAINGNPTTAGLMISKLRRCGCSAVDVYGFSFVGRAEGMPVGRYERLPKDVPPDVLEKEMAYHEFAREVTYLSRLFEGRRMRGDG